MPITDQFSKVFLQLYAVNLLQTINFQENPKLTSSRGSVKALGIIVEVIPMMYGVGEQMTSIISAGSTGMNVCCQENGYNNDVIPLMVEDKLLEKKILS